MAVGKHSIGGYPLGSSLSNSRLGPTPESPSPATFWLLSQPNEPHPSPIHLVSLVMRGCIFVIPVEFTIICAAPLAPSWLGFVNSPIIEASLK